MENGVAGLGRTLPKDRGSCPGEILIIRGEDVRSILEGRELEIADVIERTYHQHTARSGGLPRSTFLRVPGGASNRIIALPAFLEGPFRSAGIKWIASFPDNVRIGLDRASAVLILNSLRTGRPRAVLESSIISAKRTAASARLAAQQFLGASRPACAGMIGCGPINFEIALFLIILSPNLSRFVLYDTIPERARTFQSKLLALHGDREISLCASAEEVLERAPLISLATTSSTPYIGDLSRCPPGALLLHVSLRDLTPEAILASDNVVDDIEHVCREGTSVHLTEQRVGHRNFILGTLADALRGVLPPRHPDRPLVFSPFGLGVLDVALGCFVEERARSAGLGTRIPDFFPRAWEAR